MAGQTPNHPRLRVLIALAVVTTVAMFGAATVSGATGGPATHGRTSWYGIVRESVDILLGGTY